MVILKFRSKTLAEGGLETDAPQNHAKKDLEVKMREDEDLLRKRFTEQVRKEEQRFKTWEQKVNSYQYYLIKS